MCRLSRSRRLADQHWSDVSGKQSDVDVSVYNSFRDGFLGQVRVTPDVFHENAEAEGWYKLQPRGTQVEHVSGEIHLRFRFHKTGKKHYGPDDFPVLRLIGKGKFSVLTTRGYSGKTQVHLGRSIKCITRTHGKSMR